MTEPNPFAVTGFGIPKGVEYLNVDGRMYVVRTADKAALRVILARTDLQKTVRVAAERRLRTLEREAPTA